MQPDGKPTHVWSWLQHTTHPLRKKPRKTAAPAVLYIRRQKTIVWRFRTFADSIPNVTQAKASANQREVIPTPALTVPAPFLEERLARDTHNGRGRSLPRAIFLPFVFARRWGGHEATLPCFRCFSSQKVHLRHGKSQNKPTNDEVEFTAVGPVFHNRARASSRFLLMTSLWFGLVCRPPSSLSAALGDFDHLQLGVGLETFGVFCRTSHIAGLHTLQYM